MLEPARCAACQCWRVNSGRAREEGEIDTLKGVGRNGLDKGHLIAHRLQLP